MSFLRFDFVVKNSKDELDSRANVNHEKRDGWTALMLAARYNQNEVAKVLLECGANTDIKNNLGKTAWDYAKDEIIMLAILEKNFNEIVEGRKFPPCDKTAAN